MDKAASGLRRKRYIACSKRNSATNSKEKVATDDFGDASNLSTRELQEFPESHSRMAITSGRRLLTISAGRTRKGSTPSMAFRLGQHLGVGSATCALNTSTPQQLHLSPMALGNLLLRSTTSQEFHLLRRFLPPIEFDCS